MRHARLVALFVLQFAGPVLGDEPDLIPHRQDRPPNKPYPAAEAVRRMTVPAGFSVELVASEPDIVNPIAMTFDDRGRIMVVMTHNTDFGDAFEREGDNHQYFLAFAPEGYAFGVNAIVYSMIR